MNTRDLFPADDSSSWCPETSWSRIDVIQQGGENTVRSSAIEELCETYRLPVVKAFRFKHHFSRENAEDAAQDFIVWFLESGFLDRADQSEGKFRSYLFTCLDYFAQNRRRKIARAEGGDEAIRVPIHRDTAAGIPGVEIPGGEDPLDQIHLEWGLSTLNAARGLLKRSELEAGNGREWNILRKFLSLNSPLTPDEAAAKLGITPGALHTRVSRLRVRFRAHLSEQVSATVSTEDEFKEEMAFLRDIFS